MPSSQNDTLAELAAGLDLDVNTIRICHACLSYVSFPLDDGDLARARREARRMAFDLWHEGLAEPLLEALDRARGEGLHGAEAALLDVREQGPRSPVVRAVVLRLVGDLAARARAENVVIAAARPRLPLVPPDLN